MKLRKHAFPPMGRHPFTAHPFPGLNPLQIKLFRCTQVQVVQLIFALSLARVRESFAGEFDSPKAFVKGRVINNRPSAGTAATGAERLRQRRPRHTPGRRLRLRPGLHQPGTGRRHRGQPPEERQLNHLTKTFFTVPSLIRMMFSPFSGDCILCP